MRSPVILLGTSAALAAIAAATPVAAHPHVWVQTRTQVVFEGGALTALRYSWIFDEMYTTNAIEGLDTNKNGVLEPAELEELTKVNIEGLKEFDYFTTATMAGEAVKFGDATNYSMELVETDDAPGPQLVGTPDASGSVGAAPPEEKKGLIARFTGWVAGLFGRKPAAIASAPDGKPAQAAPEKSKVLALHLTLPFKDALPAARLDSEAKGFQFNVGDAQMFIWFEPAAKDGLVMTGAPAGCRLALVEPEMDEQQKKLAEAFGRLGSGTVAMPGAKVNAVVCAKP